MVLKTTKKVKSSTRGKKMTSDHFDKKKFQKEMSQLKNDLRGIDKYSHSRESRNEKLNFKNFK